MVYIDYDKYRAFMVGAAVVEVVLGTAAFFLLRWRRPKNPPKRFTFGKTADGKLCLNVKCLKFVGAKSELLPDQGGTLDELSAALLSRRLSKMNIVIAGHTCYTGVPDEENAISLSLARAETVAGELSRRRVPRSRMRCVGKGYSEPVVKDPQTNEQAEENRRVEIILEK